MKLLSEELEHALKVGILKLIKDFLTAKEKEPKLLIGLIPQKKVMKELEVKHTTLLRWEQAGLKRYQPPLEDTKKIYYKRDDILIFLGAERQEGRQ